MPMIYLAAPYTHPSALIQEERVRTTAEAVDILLSQGYDCIFAPTVYGHALEKFGAGMTARKHGFWMSQCMHMLQCADELMILPLVGWRESRGIAEEVRFARAVGKQILVPEPKQFPFGEPLTCDEFNEWSRFHSWPSQ